MADRKAYGTLVTLLIGGVAISPISSNLIIPPALEAAQPDYNIIRAANLVDKLAKMELSNSSQIAHYAKESAKAMINEYVAQLQLESAIAISANQQDWKVPADKCYHIVTLYRIAHTKYGDELTSPNKVGFAELRTLYYNCPINHKFG